jgi:hypothetical protein
MPEIEQGRLLRFGSVLFLLPAQFKNVAPKMTLAVDVDKAKSGHGAGLLSVRSGDK